MLLLFGMAIVLSSQKSKYTLAIQPVSSFIQKRFPYSLPHTFFQRLNVKVTRSIVRPILFLTVNPVRSRTQTRQWFAFLFDIIVHFVLLFRPKAILLEQSIRIVLHCHGLVREFRLHRIERRFQLRHAHLSCRRVGLSLLLLGPCGRFETLETFVPSPHDGRSKFIPFVLQNTALKITNNVRCQ